MRYSSIGGFSGLMLLGGALLGVTAAHAQPSDVAQLSIEELSSVEITTVSRRPVPLAQAPAAIYVITAEDIRRSGAVSLPEVLRLAPNLEVARMNSLAYTVTARGFNSPESANKLLVLVDGRSVYSPLASTVFWENISVPLADIARIEVVSGPGGTLYGANAVNGVISIVTKSAGETQGGLIDATGGSTDASLMARYGFSPWDGASLRVYGGVSHANNTAPVAATDIARFAWARNMGGFRFDQALDGDSFTLEGQVYANHTPVLEIEKGRGGDLNGHWSHAFANGSSLEAQLSFDQSIRILPGLAREQLDTFDLQIQHNTSLGWGDSFIWGGETRRWKESFYTPGPFIFANPTTTISLGSLFAQDEIPLGSDLKLTLGLKGEHNSYSGLDFLPNVRLAWQASKSDLVWTSVSRAVRTPSKVDRELMAPGILLPSPDFASEMLTAYEAGYRGEPLQNFSFSASLYYNVYGGIRSDLTTPVTILPIILKNDIHGANYGAELWGKLALSDRWRLNLGYSWLHRDLRVAAGKTDIVAGQAIGQDPAYQAQIRSEMNLLDDLEFDLGLRAVGKVTQKNSVNGAQIFLVPAYFQADARLGWQVLPNTEVSLAGLNLFDQRHLEARDPSTYPPQYVPRSFFISLRQSF